MMNIQGIGYLTDQTKWNVSSNVLCNYMKKPEYLEMILKNKAIIPRYVVEQFDYFGVEGLHKLAFPMTCFCDIPFSKVGGHMSRYGRYGIALDKKTVISKFKVQPIHYINSESPLMSDFRTAFSEYYGTGKKVHPEDKVLLDYLTSTILYMKPISGIEKLNGEDKIYVYQDECEWRYIPTENFPEGFELVLPQNKATEKAKEYYSKCLQENEQTWIKFDWEDVRYIIVPDDSALKRIVEVIREMTLPEPQKYYLVSRIEVGARFTEDLI